MKSKESKNTFPIPKFDGVGEIPTPKKRREVFYLFEFTQIFEYNVRQPDKTNNGYDCDYSPQCKIDRCCMTDKGFLTILGLRQILGFTQEYMGMLLGMGKQHVSRIELKKRNETLQHKESIAMLSYLQEKGILNDYVEWRFGFSINRHFYKNSTPLDDLKRSKNNI